MLFDLAIEYFNYGEDCMPRSMVHIQVIGEENARVRANEFRTAENFIRLRMIDTETGELLEER